MSWFLVNLKYQMSKQSCLNTLELKELSQWSRKSEVKAVRDLTVEHRLRLLKALKTVKEGMSLDSKFPTVDN